MRYALSILVLALAACSKPGAVSGSSENGLQLTEIARLRVDYLPELRAFDLDLDFKEGGFKRYRGSLTNGVLVDEDAPTQKDPFECLSKRDNQCVQARVILRAKDKVTAPVTISFFRIRDFKMGQIPGNFPTAEVAYFIASVRKTGQRVEADRSGLAVIELGARKFTALHLANAERQERMSFQHDTSDPEKLSIYQHLWNTKLVGHVQTEGVIGRGGRVNFSISDLLVSATTE